MVYLAYCAQKDSSRSYIFCLNSAILKGPSLNYWMEAISNRPEYSEVNAVFRAFEQQFGNTAHQKQIEALLLSIIMENTMKKLSCN